MARNPQKEQAQKDEGANVAWPLVGALGVSSLLLGVLQLIFLASSSAIIAATPAPPAQIITPWARWAIAQHDGIETYVVLPGMLLFLAVSVGLTFALRSVSKNMALLFASAGGLAAAAIILRTRSSEFGIEGIFAFFPLAYFSLRILLGIVTSLLIWAWYQIHRRTSRIGLRIGLVAGFIAFALAVVLSLPEPSLSDYGYFIGPGLKLLQGERIGSFYMQYNLVETLLFTAMIAANLKVHVMAVVLSILFVGWYIIYYLIAKRIFRQRFVALLCMLALVVARLFAIRGHPVQVPQVLPLRLDLWAPLLLAVMSWGLTSWRTSLVFGGAYALDSTFGFLFAAVYAGALAVSWWWTGGLRVDLRLKLPLLLPTVAAGCFQKLVFGSFVSPAANHYLGVQIGFMPISGTSMFWPIAMLLGWAAAVFAVRHTKAAGRIGLLLCAFAAVQFVYFFGRSHDHNLLNVSAIWLFAIFLAVDQAFENTNAQIVTGTILVFVLTVMSTQQFLPKFYRIGVRLWSGVWVESYSGDAELDANRGKITADTVLVDPSDDAYMNYRLGLPQRGFFVPFEANVFLDDTARWMDDQIRSGMHLRTTDARWSMWLKEFNETPVMKQRGRQFAALPGGNGNLLEIVEQ